MDENIEKKVKYKLFADYDGQDPNASHCNLDLGVVERGDDASRPEEAEVKRIESKFPTFKFHECEYKLPKTEVYIGHYRARIMSATDPRQVMLGYYTNCEQCLDGSDEDLMMYGLMNPNAGFFVIEDMDTGKVIAQAEREKIPSPTKKTDKQNTINV